MKSHKNLYVMVTLSVVAMMASWTVSPVQAKFSFASLFKSHNQAFNFGHYLGFWRKGQLSPNANTNNRQTNKVYGSRSYSFLGKSGQSSSNAGESVMWQDTIMQTITVKEGDDISYRILRGRQFDVSVKVKNGSVIVGSFIHSQPYLLEPYNNSWIDFNAQLNRPLRNIHVRLVPNGHKRFTGTFHAEENFINSDEDSAKYKEVFTGSIVKRTKEGKDSYVFVFHNKLIRYKDRTVEYVSQHKSHELVWEESIKRQMIIPQTFFKQNVKSSQSKIFKGNKYDLEVIIYSDGGVKIYRFIHENVLSNIEKPYVYPIERLLPEDIKKNYNHVRAVYIPTEEALWNSLVAFRDVGNFKDFYHNPALTYTEYFSGYIKRRSRGNNYIFTIVANDRVEKNHTIFRDYNKVHR